MQPELEFTPYAHVAFDIWGPACVQTTGSKSLMLVATDQDGTECATWYLTSKTTKSKIVCLEVFDTRAETQWVYRIKYICTDGGTEFNNEL